MTRLFNYIFIIPKYYKKHNHIINCKGELLMSESIINVTKGNDWIAELIKTTLASMDKENDVRLALINTNPQVVIDTLIQNYHD